MGRDHEEFALDGESEPGPAQQGTHGAEEGAPSRRRGPREWRRSPWPWVAAAAALVIAGVVAAPRPGAVVDPWGRVPDLATPPEPAWEIKRPDIQSLWAFGGVMAYVAGTEVVGLDADTGEQRWSVTATVPRCSSTGVTLVCATDDATVVEIDPRSGRMTHERVEGVVAATRFEGDLIALTESGLRRIDAHGTVWEAPDAAIHPNDWTAGPDVVGGMVVMLRRDVGDPDGAQIPAGFDPQTGEPAETFGGYPTRIRDGVWAFTPGGLTHFLLRGESEPRRTDWPANLTAAMNPEISSEDLPEDPSGRAFIPVAATDGVVVGYRVGAQPPETAAIDMATGEILWRRDHIGAFRTGTLVDEQTVAYVAVGSGLNEQSATVAVDARTGVQRWRIEGNHAVVTDGEHLYLATTSTLSGWKLGS